MNRSKAFLFVAALALMAGTVALLAWSQNHQRLGQPGVKTSPIPGSIRLRVDLPERVLNYQSEWVDPDPTALGGLPQDTSFGQRLYKAPDGFQLQYQVVLMGADRTSLHKPQFCLEGQGFHIDQSRNLETHVRVGRPIPYDLPVVRLVATKEFNNNGQKVTARALYVYWYVADGALDASVSGKGRMWSMAQELLTTGVLQRWAYVSCLTICAPGQEDATFERMKQFIAASVPDFQLTPSAGGTTTQARQ